MSEKIMTMSLDEEYEEGAEEAERLNDEWSEVNAEVEGWAS